MLEITTTIHSTFTTLTTGNVAMTLAVDVGNITGFRRASSSRQGI